MSIVANVVVRGFKIPAGQDAFIYNVISYD
jgi:hypothetical protein